LDCDTERYRQALPRSVPLSARLEDGKFLNCGVPSVDGCSMEPAGSARGLQYIDMDAYRTASRWRANPFEVSILDSNHVLAIKISGRIS
jgi:hypothetical protein